MSSDSVPIEAAESHSLGDMIYGMVSSFNYKLWIFIFIIFLIVTNSIFTSRVIGLLPNTTQQDGKPTNLGVLAQGGALVLSGIVASVAIQSGVI